MARRRKVSAIGLAMLDLISNSLAAVIILFIILSSLRKPSIPPERIEGILIVEYKLTRPLSNADFDIWIEPPYHENRERSRYFGKEILKGEGITQMNFDEGVFGAYEDCIGKGGQIMPPCAMSYSNGSDTRYLIIRKPPTGEWGTGILYQDYDKVEVQKLQGEASIKAWFVYDNNKKKPLDTIYHKKPVLEGTTDIMSLKIRTPDWEIL